MSKVIFTPLRQIPTPGGDVMHALKDVDPGFEGFGEAYFTSVTSKVVKGWKRHRSMVMNLIVPCGGVRFVVHDEGRTGPAQIFDLSPDAPNAYGRLTVPPGYWMAFSGLTDGFNLVLNIASIRHDPAEADAVPIDTFPWIGNR